MKNSDIKDQLLISLGKLRKYAYNLTLDSNKTKDLVQETAIIVLCNAEKFEDDEKFIYWARAIMHNTFINDTKREERRHNIREQHFTPPPITNNYDEGYTDSEVEINDIYNTIDELPGNAGKVMRLLISGHKYVEISVIMNIPLGTVKTRINLSRAILKKKLKDYLN